MCRGQRIWLPVRYHDELPPQPPVPEPTSSQHAELLPSHQQGNIQATVEGSPPNEAPHLPPKIYETLPNTFGIFRRYLTGKPTIYPILPDEEIYNSPAFDVADSEVREKRPWWLGFGHSLEDVAQNPLGPFTNVSTMRMMHWLQNGSNSKSAPEIDRLVHEVILSPDFRIEDLNSFSTARELGAIDRYDEQRQDSDSTYLFSPNDGWIETSIEIPLPCEGFSFKSEDDAPKYRVNGVYYRKPMEIIKATLNDPFIETYHWTPHEEYWKPSKDARAERIYSELYNSDAFIKEHQRIAQDNVNRGLETVVLSIMFWSDSTHLANFGTASLWPIYMYFGNQSKYIRSKTTSFSANHLAYIPKVCEILLANGNI